MYCIQHLLISKAYSLNFLTSHNSSSRLEVSCVPISNRRKHTKSDEGLQESKASDWENQNVDLNL